MKLHESLADQFRKNGSKLVRVGFVNGLPGFITLEADGELQTTALEIEDGKIAAIYVVRNPDKLQASALGSRIAPYVLLRSPAT